MENGKIWQSSLENNFTYLFWMQTNALFVLTSVREAIPSSVREAKTKKWTLFLLVQLFKVLLTQLEGIFLNWTESKLPATLLLFVSNLFWSIDN